MLEKEIQKSILQYLNYLGHFCWRNNTGAFKDKKGGFYRFGLVGSSDIIGIHKETGKLIAIEVKQKGKKATVYQNSFLDEIKKRNGIAGVVSSIQEVHKLLNG